MRNQSFIKVLVVGSVLFLTACGGDDNHHSSNNKDNEQGIPQNNIQNPIVRSENYTLNDDVLGMVSSERTLLTYKMLGVEGNETIATTLVFTPKTPQPAQGWPIVVWAHGTTGVADQCAPSQQGLKGNEYFVAKLLNAGYVVVAPDYEGLGTAGSHPFLNVKSEAYSITDAVVATRQYLMGQGKNISQDWITVGHSQGGQAALGAAEYASRAKLNYKGTVAIAPASNLQAILTGGESSVKDQPATVQIPVLAGLDTFTSLIVAGMQGYKTGVSYNEVFKPDLAAIAPLAESECFNEVGISIAGNMQSYAIQHNNTLSGYGRTQDNFMQIPVIQKFLEKDAQPLNTQVATPIIVYQGSADTTVPKPATDVLVYSATQRGMQIKYKTDVEQGTLWTHSTVYTDNLDAIIEDVKSLMPIQ